MITKDKTGEIKEKHDKNTKLMERWQTSFKNSVH